MYLLMLFFDVYLNGLYGMDRDLLACSFFLHSPAWSPFPKSYKAKNNQPTNQQNSKPNKEKPNNQLNKNPQNSYLPFLWFGCHLK